MLLQAIKDFFDPANGHISIDLSQYVFKIKDESNANQDPSDGKILVVFEEMLHNKNPLLDYNYLSTDANQEVSANFTNQSIIPFRTSLTSSGGYENFKLNYLYLLHLFQTPVFREYARNNNVQIADQPYRHALHANINSITEDSLQVHHGGYFDFRVIYTYTLKMTGLYDKDTAFYKTHQTEYTQE